VAHDELIKFVAALVAVIFIYWHGVPPFLLEFKHLKKDKFSQASSQEEKSKDWKVRTPE
jgi:hypothetical protein